MKPETIQRYARELAAYEKHRARLEGRHRGRVVLLHGEELLGPFRNLDKAVAAVVQRWGRPEQCLWQEVGKPVDLKPLWGLPDDEPLPPPQPAPEVRYAKEFATYERHRAELERDYRGEFAVVQCDQVVGIYADQYKALEEGDRRFGLGNFLLMEIGDPVYFFPNCELPPKESQ